MFQFLIILERIKHMLFISLAVFDGFFLPTEISLETYQLWAFFFSPWKSPKLTKHEFFSWTFRTQSTILCWEKHVHVTLSAVSTPETTGLGVGLHPCFTDLRDNCFKLLFQWDLVHSKGKKIITVKTTIFTREALGRKAFFLENQPTFFFKFKMGRD